MVGTGKAHALLLKSVTIIFVNQEQDRAIVLESTHVHRKKDETVTEGGIIAALTSVPKPRIYF